MPPSISISTGRPLRVDRFSRRARLVEHRRDERLPAEAGLHAHHEEHVDLAEVGLDRAVGRRGFEREAHSHVERADAFEQRTGFTQLDMDGAPVGPRVGEGLDEIARVRNHQVAVEVEVGAGPQRLHDRWADREVGHVVAVHAVDVEQVGVADPFDLGRELGEVGGEDGRSDLHRREASGSITGHFFSSTSTNMPSVSASDGRRSAPRPCGRHGEPGGSSAQGGKRSAQASTPTVSASLNVHTA